MRTSHPMWPLIVAWLLFAGTFPSSAAAQGLPPGQYPRYGSLRSSPYEALMSQVQAQAELLRANAAASVDYAEARRIRALAVRQEIINSVERVKAYWNRKEIGEAELLKRKYHHLKSLKKRNTRTWDRLQHHPEFNGPGITNGRLLNFLLHRLSGTLLAYEFSRDGLQGGQADDQALQQDLALTARVLHGLQLRQRGTNGQELVFRADEGTALQVDYWPFALRHADFDDDRRGFERARQQVVTEAADGSISNASIQKLDEAVLQLRNSFDEHDSRSRRFQRGMASWNEYQTARQFLNSLVGEVGRLKATGRSDAFDGSLKFEGDNLFDLLRYMTRNGLEFAPARPGDEAAYHTLSGMMRDLYATVADTDTSLKE